MPGYLCVLFDGAAEVVGAGLIEADGLEIAIENAKARCGDLPDDFSFGLWQFGKLIYKSSTALSLVPSGGT